MGFLLKVKAFEKGVLLILMGKVYIGKEALGQTLVFILQTPQHNKAGNDPKDAWITVVNKLSKESILFFSSFNNSAKCDYL